jgi:hypothetical protein
MILDSIIDFIPKDPTHANPNRARVHFHASQNAPRCSQSVPILRPKANAKDDEEAQWSPHSRPIVREIAKEREFKRDDKPSKTYERSHVSL